MTPEDVLQQLRRLTRLLIEMELSIEERTPSIYESGQGARWVGVRMNRGTSIALRDVPYLDVFHELLESKAYWLRLADGSLLQTRYSYTHDHLVGHRLAYFPNPDVETYQADPDLYQLEMPYAEILRRSYLPTPIRFDFDSQHNSDSREDHPHAHLTFGQLRDCRIPVSCPLTPYQFMEFIIRSYYFQIYKVNKDRILRSQEQFDECMSEPERRLAHFRINN